MDYGTIRILIWIVVLVLSLVSTTAMHTLHFAHVSTRACVFFYQEARKKKERERSSIHVQHCVHVAQPSKILIFLYIFFACSQSTTLSQLKM